MATNELVDKIYQYLHGLGIDHPIYVLTLIIIPWMYVVYRNDLKRWKELDRYRRSSVFRDSEMI